MKLTPIAGLVVLAATTIGCKKEEPRPDGAKKTEALTVVSGDKKKSVGREHLPSGCEIVASVDIPRFREMKVVKARLEEALQRFEAPPVPNAPVDPETAADIKKAKEFLAKTRIDLRTDPGELVYCTWNLNQRSAQPSPFVAVLGGQFVPGAAMDALDSFGERLKGLLQRARSGAGKQPPPELIQIAGVKVAHDKAAGTYMAQAKDGAFVFGNERLSFERALDTGKDYEKYQLPPEPVALVVNQSAGPAIAPQLSQSPFAPAAAAFGGAWLGYQEALMRLKIVLTDPKLVPALQSNLDMFIKPNPMMPPNPFSAALSQAKVTTDESSLTLEVPLPDEMTAGLLQQAGVGSAPPRPLVAPLRPTSPPRAPVPAAP